MSLSRPCQTMSGYEIERLDRVFCDIEGLDYELEDQLYNLALLQVVIGVISEDKTLQDQLQKELFEAASGDWRLFKDERFAFLGIQDLSGISRPAHQS